MPRVWRCFSTLRNISDAEGEHILNRATQLMPASAEWLPAAAASALALAFILGSVAARSQLLPLAGPLDPAAESLVVALWFVLGASAIFFASWFLFNTLVMLVAIARDLRRLCCPKCRHPLQGLRVIFSRVDVQVPGDARVRCPECGRTWVLLEIGVSPADLVPFEQREVPRDLGRVRRQPRM
ncbi:MAG: hypothetical protein SFZ23_03840 [Planctomycetota bacterium]|nr:hypothetical protein [Planctomycetota bacterium]